MARRKVKTSAELAATLEARKAIAFKALKAKFDWTNDDWVMTFLPRIRMAVLFLQRDREGCEDLMGKIVKEGLAPDMMEGWCGTLIS